VQREHGDGERVIEIHRPRLSHSARHPRGDSAHAERRSEIFPAFAKTEAGRRRRWNILSASTRGDDTTYETTEDSR
jgi:hypothetical protein